MLGELLDQIADPPPKRRWELTLKVGADSMEELRGAFREAMYNLRSAEDAYHTASGGVGAKWSINLEWNSDMTPERYMDELEAWLKRQPWEGTSDG